jgi:arginyl-tRNA synthetase
MSEELGKLDGFSDSEKQNIYRIIGLGALKYFMLKVDPKKNMTFNPEESIDFNGNTGPFVQYTYTRINSIKRKAEENKIVLTRTIDPLLNLSKKEIDLIKLLADFPTVLAEAGQNLSPAIVANYCYELVKEYNQFYHDFLILKEENTDLRNFRLLLSDKIAQAVYTGMGLLGIEMPERM